MLLLLFSNHLTQFAKKNNSLIKSLLLYKYIEKAVNTLNASLLLNSNLHFSITIHLGSLGIVKVKNLLKAKDKC